MSLSLFELVNYILKPKVLDEDSNNSVLTLTTMNTLKDFEDLDRNHNSRADHYFCSLVLLKLEDSDSTEDCLTLLDESTELINKNSEYLNIYCESFDNILISKTNSCKDLETLLLFCEIGKKVESKCKSFSFEYNFLYKSIVSLRISNDLNNFLLKISKIQDFELISKGLEILEKAYIANQDVFHIIFLFFSVVLDLVEDILKDFELKKLENEESQEKFEKISVWVALMFAVQNKNMDQKTRIFNLKQKLKPIFNELQIGYSTVKHRDPEILIEDEENQDYHYSNIKLIDKKLLSYQDAPIFAISKKDFKVGIHLGQYNSQNKTHKIVIKSYQITNNMESVRSQIENEIKVYQILSKNRDETNSFLKYFGSIFEDNTIKMVMDFCENNLMDYIDHLKEIGFRFQETQFTMISYKLVNSFRIMADLGIFHQDIKPHNLLVDSHWNLKIIDFNVSLIKPQDFTIFGTGTYPIQGTLGYLSPELQQMIEERRGHQKFNPEKSDVYSLGLVLFQMLTYEKVQGLSSNKLRKMVEKLDFISGYSKTFLKKMLEQDPSQRPKFAEVLSMIPFDPKTLTGAAGLPFK